MSILARATSDPSPVVDRLRRIVNDIDPDLAILEAATGRDLERARTLVLEVGAIAASLLGGLALLLAMAGLYGVMADLVSRRTREIGVRMALGADAARLMRMVLGDGARPVLMGLAFATVLGAIARMAFRPLFLRMMPALDPLMLSVVPVLFLAAALLASYFPARRAARVDPNVALRHL
jgi:putative ABC transport system permease protein